MSTILRLVEFAIDGGESKSLVPLKLFFAIHYCAFSTQTYLPIYFDHTENFDKMQIGILLTLPCVCAIVAPPIWGGVADVIKNQKLVHIFCLVTAAVFMFSLRFVSTFNVMCIMLFVANFQTQPTWSLLDQTAMTMLVHIGGVYGKQRLYGAVGYGIGGYFAGVMAAAIGIAWCFNMVLGLSFISLFILLRFIPAYQPDDEGPKTDYLQSLAIIWDQPDVLVLYIVVLLAGIMGGLIDNFLFLWYFNLSGNDTRLVGVIIATETISELPLFFFSNKIFERFGTPRCIIFSVIAYGIRMIVYTYAQNPWVWLPFEILHGMTFGLLWAAFTNYVFQSSPEGTEGTMIGLLTAVQKGMGAACSTLMGGYMYEHFGGRIMWGTGAFVIFPLAILFSFIFSCLAREYPEKSAATREKWGSSSSLCSIDINERIAKKNGYTEIDGVPEIL
ncbi:Major Facilitator Superfamily (MFS) transporter [Phytophthora megakarya]|uniref:Major Facilitator Superfamily (MFS) transporter n=1 Tax=Phytophthora megakarya TaxID=4795 RepID=A0A225WKK9_9STRA|nr:Major Facilitator Superfamily (MFS) transporter [Phytophthora megakarya]